MATPGAAMQFAPFASEIDFNFFTSLAHHKINHDKLDVSARRVLGLYELREKEDSRSCRMQIHPNALSADSVPSGYYRGEGIIRNVNTIEEFKKANHSEILQKSGRTIWDAINDGSIFSIPSLLSSFTVLSFADLKKHHFHYWCGYPALHSAPSWTKVGATQHLTEDESSGLVDVYQTWRYSVDTRQHGFFLVKRLRRGGHDDHNLSDTHKYDEEDERESEPQWKAASLGDYEQGFFNDVADRENDTYIAFADPSNFEEHPGWPLRNLLVLIRQRWGLKKVKILGYRDTHATRHQSRSVIWVLETAESKMKNLSLKDSMPKVTGWERNRDKKLLPQKADLSMVMDPKLLADSAVDLNNSLMRWRIAPNLDLDKIKATKCLLLGAGTLGSYVSRCLLGWGVRKITFVDNATISFSNPVRQPLFKFDDCLNGGKPKAETAAAALREIYPGVDATGYGMNVPMAGHPLRDAAHEASTKAEFEKLVELFKEHDAIFLLMDTRESRWLPTLLGKALGKTVLNAALGFDTYLVMRHGIKPEIETEDDEDDEETKKSQREQAKPVTLGCYFCNDIVAPGDSLTDRTLDQMCTVSRPGNAPIASGLLVELLVSLIQHPQGAAAPAAVKIDDDRGGHPLGIVPHQIRGFLSSFSNKMVHAPAYEYCSACSDRIVDAYEDGGWEFIKRAMNETGYVEEISGLAELQRSAALIEDEGGVDWEEEEGEGELL